MNFRWLAVSLIVGVIFPTALADVNTTSIVGSTVQIEVENAFVALPVAAGKPFAVSVQGSHWDVRTHSDYRNSTLRSSFTQGYLASTDEHTDSRLAVEGAAEGVLFAGATVGEGLVIVRPLSPSYVASIDHDGPFNLASISGEILEESHAWADYLPRHATYYQYVVNDTLRMGLEGSTKLEIRGDFQVYLWGIQGQINDGEENHQVWTGHKLVERQVVNGYEPTFAEEQFTYATMAVYDGMLSYSGDDSSSVLYASEIGARSTEQVALSNTAGTIPAREGEYVVAGSSAVNGGSFQWSHESDGSIGVKFLDTPGEVRGDSVAFQPAPLIERSWFLPVALAVMVLAAVVAAYLAPAVAGRRSADAGPGLGGLRTAGFRRWAASADDRGHLRRAAFWAGRAHRSAPHDWDATLERAIYLAQVGRFSKALALHEAAHGGFQFLGDPEQLAHNAYEAARSAARLRRDEDAVDWLRVAVEADPGLAADMASDPSFATLRAFPDYLSLQGPVAQLQVRP